MNHQTATLERPPDGGVEHEETAALIASHKVEGTKGFNKDGEKLGQIENSMVGKRTGRVEYAVLSFGGFFGSWEEPLPHSVGPSVV